MQGLETVTPAARGQVTSNASADDAATTTLERPPPTYEVGWFMDTPVPPAPSPLCLTGSGAPAVAAFSATAGGAAAGRLLLRSSTGSPAGSSGSTTLLANAALQVLQAIGGLDATMVPTLQVSSRQGCGIESCDVTSCWL